MNEQTEKLIRDLAEKLGTTTEHLWSVLVKQAPISAATELVTFGGAAAILAVFACLVRKWWNREVSEEEMAARILVSVLLGAAALCEFIGLCVALPLILSGFFNPEYWALRQLMH